MRIGVPKEIKNQEYRVGLTPSSVRALVAAGHDILVETHAGAGIDLWDEDYIQAGAIIIDTPARIFAETDMIVKVKELQPQEYTLLRDGQILCAFLHLAPDPLQAQALIQSNCIAIAYETVTDDHGGLPLLAPMSAVAGRMSIQAGAHCLEKPQGGRGIILSGVAGVAPGRVVVIGAGVVGSNAIRIAVGMEAEVIAFDKSLPRLRALEEEYGVALQSIFATQDAIDRAVKEADLVVGAALIPGASAPQLVSRAMLSQMKTGSVLVDVSIDQGGCFETSKPTTHDNPTYIIDGIVHYCVTNMPGGAPRTSTFALNNATLPFILTIANKGLQKALLEDLHLMLGLNVYKGKITYPAVADALGLKCFNAKEVLRNGLLR